MTETTGSTATPESGNPEGAEDAVDAAEGTATEGGKALSRRERKRANRESGDGKTPGKRAKAGLFARIGLYYRQIIAELRKVVWPTKSELMNYTSVVVVFVAVMIGLVATLDWGFAKASFWIFG